MEFAKYFYICLIIQFELIRRNYCTKAPITPTAAPATTPAPAPAKNPAEDACKNAKPTPTGLTGDEPIEMYWDFKADNDNKIIQDICRANRDVFGGKLNMHFLVGARLDCQEGKINKCPNGDCNPDADFACAADALGGKDEGKFKNIYDFSCCATAKEDADLWSCGIGIRNVYDYNDSLNSCLDDDHYENILFHIGKDMKPYVENVDFDIYPLFKVVGGARAYPGDFSWDHHRIMQHPPYGPDRGPYDFYLKRISG